MVVLFLAFLLLVIFFLVASGRNGVEIGFPVVLDGGWEFIHVREKHGDVPHILGRKSFVPGGHAGVTDAGANGVEDVPLGIVGRIRNKVRRRRVERGREGRGLSVETSMTERAIHGVELHAVFAVLVGGSERVADTGSMTVHGGVNG